MNIPVIYEDGWLLILDKPAGLLIIPTPHKEQRTLTSIVNEELKKKGLSYRLHPCHRLDRETSGLIIYAKGKSMQRKMLEEFKEGRVKKTYVAFIHGIPLKEEGRIASPIERKNAITRYRIVAKKKDFAVAKVEPLTGRTNQIRIHFKRIGHPLVGEDRFVFRRDYKLKGPRLCLHASSLEFIHPSTGEKIRLSARLPQDLQSFLDRHD